MALPLPNTSSYPTHYVEAPLPLQHLCSRIRSDFHFAGDLEATTEADLQSTLYRELQQMLHDLAQIGKIDQIVSDLHRPPPELSQK